MKKEIPLSVPNLNIDIVKNLQECIETGWVSTGGRFIQEFEKKVAAYLAMESAVSVQSGTAGLHLALIALGVQADNEVIVPTLTFVAAVNPIRYLNAEPIFMDCDDTLCMNPDKLEAFLETECEQNDRGSLINKKTGNIVKAIVAVHIFGNLCDMERIMSLASKYHLKVLEDATEALGSYFTEGKYKGRFAGTIGDAGVYSFNANKIITTGGGGMIVSEHKELLERMRHLSLTAKTDTLYFVHDEVGYNYRMLNLQAALGVSQIDELEHFIEIKRNNYRLYEKLLAYIPGLQLLQFKSGIRPNYWFYSVLVDETEFGIDRNQLMKKLIEHGIQCRPIWKLIHTLDPYTRSQSRFIEKAYYYEKNILNVPCSTNLTQKDIEYLCEKVEMIRSEK